jgi:hypothetical protein
MKSIQLILILFCAACYASAQDKGNYVAYNKLTEVKGTPYTIASMEDRGKMFEVKNNYLLFIHTLTGESTKVDFGKDVSLRSIEQVKIDSLGINCILVAGKLTDVDQKNGIDWNDPTQLVVLSSDGKSKTLLTESSYFTTHWEVNRTTGTIVVTGYLDSNKNFTYDKKDKNEIRVYDIKKLSLIHTL